MSFDQILDLTAAVFSIHLPRAERSRHFDVLALKIPLQELYHPRRPAVSLRNQRYVLDVQGSLACGPEREGRDPAGGTINPAA